MTAAYLGSRKRVFLKDPLQVLQKTSYSGTVNYEDSGVRIYAELVKGTVDNLSFEVDPEEL